MLTRVPYNVKAPESLFKKYTHRELELASLWFIFHKKYSHSTVIIFFSSMASKPINIRWNKTDSQPC